MSEFSSPEEIAEKLGISSKTVRDWLRSGDLVGIKVGKSWRIHQRDLARLLDEQLYEARKIKAERLHPEVEWKRGQCRECGILMPEPASRNNWVCSPDCLTSYNAKSAAIVGHGTEEFVFCCGSVVPPY